MVLKRLYEVTVAAIYILVLAIVLSVGLVAHKPAMVVGSLEPPIKTDIKRVIKHLSTTTTNIQRDVRVVASRGSVRYTEVTLELTAYTANDAGMDGKGTTRVGLPVDIGVIAVDPAVIPLGSIVWVPGVGYLIALDTGGAIKGYKGDIYMPNRKDALEWGRRTMKVKVYRLH